MGRATATINDTFERRPSGQPPLVGSESKIDQLKPGSDYLVHTGLPPDLMLPVHVCSTILTTLSGSGT